MHEFNFYQILKETHDPKHAKDNWEKDWNMFKVCRSETASEGFIIYMDGTDVWE